MANIKRIEGKTGVSYKITVSAGRDHNGKQIRHYTTWTPEKGMTPRQIEKAVQKAAFEFEKKIEQGFLVDDRQTFAQYAEYVIGVKRKEGRKRRTLERYEELLKRINPAIGHLKLAEIRPQHLNAFYDNLAEPGISEKGDTATALPSFQKATAGMTRAKLAAAAGVAPNTVAAACRGNPVSLSTADALATVLRQKTDMLFQIHKGKGTLSPKTILEHHRLIRTILAQAEKEMLVPYNAAAKATPPKVESHKADYFQAEEIARILEALETEPLKWKTITHLLMMTGCRRGEIMGLQWDKVDFENRRLKIDQALLYSTKVGVYKDTTKTGNERLISLPSETMDMLRQYRQGYLELKMKNGDRWHDTGYVFVQDNGEPMNPDSITSWLNDFSKRHNLPHIHPHAFRHTAASLLIASGQDIVSVSKRLGHAKVSTTTDIYSHVIQEADERAGERLADIMLRPGKKKASG